MLDYKICKTLKEAGFPLKKHSNQTTQPQENAYVIDHMQYCIPTLSELIEACGNRFGSLARNGAFKKFTPHNNKWEVWETNTQFCIGGKTPEEAVANLWLKLNNTNKGGSPTE